MLEGSASIVGNVQRARCIVAAFSMFLQHCSLCLQQKQVNSPGEGNVVQLQQRQMW